MKAHISSKNPWEVGRKCSWWFEYMNDQTPEVIKKHPVYDGGEGYRTDAFLGDSVIDIWGYGKWQNP